MAVDSGTLTPADVERRRKFAEGLLTQGISTDPVGHPLAAVARALQGGIGGYVSGKSERDSAQERARAMQQLQGLIGSQTSGQPADMAKLLTTASDPWLGQGGSMVAGKLLESQLPGKPPNSMREFELSQSNPAYAQFLDRKRPQTQVINNLPGQPAPPEGAEFYKELDKDSAKMYGTLVAEGPKVGEAGLQIDRLEQLLTTAPQGAPGVFKQIAGNYGINSEGLSDIQAAQALINQLVPQQRPAGSGPMSDADLELFKQSMPRIINQPGGNKTIIETLRGINGYRQQQSRIAEAVANREMTPKQGRQELAKLTNPLAGFGKSTGDEAAPAKVRRYNPATGKLE